MPLNSEPRLPDIVRDWKIEAEVSGDYTKHIVYESGLSARERHIRKEETWKRQRLLGQGGYGTVYLEKCTQGDQPKLRAVKKIKSQDVEHSRELEAILRFSHKRYNYCFVQSYGWFESGDSIFISMEYLELGDLQRHLIKPLPESEAQQITLQVLEGLKYMHENGFVHRDVKPANTMVVTAGPDWFVKIADFGISKRRQPGVTSLRTKQLGTMGFAAPELLNLFQETVTSSYTWSVDIWSLGAMAYLMLTHTLPFRSFGDLYEYAHKESSFPTHSLSKCNVSEEGHNFITKLMSPKSQDRPAAHVAMGHGWLSSINNDKDAQLSNFETEKESDTLSCSSSTSIASKAWSEQATNAMTRLDPDEATRESVTTSTPTDQTTIKPISAIYQPPSVEDSQNTIDIDTINVLPANWPHVLESSTDIPGQGDTVLAASPTSTGSIRKKDNSQERISNTSLTDRETTIKNSTESQSADHDKISKKSPELEMIKPSESNKPVNPKKQHSENKRPLVLNTKHIENSRANTSSGKHRLATDTAKSGVAMKQPRSDPSTASLDSVKIDEYGCPMNS
ncbi:hypothetical protein TrVFT333_000798 [Trichoderma virens FT-333]|nr:hypothetical protein TrVFT333_000798 [Trichoderma virens FT-333]